MKQVSIYSTPTCPYCKMEKAYLDTKGITYMDYDVANDQVKAEEMIHKTGQMGVPVTVIKDRAEEQVLIGFNKEALNQALELHNG